MYENLHQNVNENMFSFPFLMQVFMSFYDGQLKQKICYSSTLLISFMLFNPFQMAVQFFKTVSNFPKFGGPNNFSKIQQAPGPDFRQVGKSLIEYYHSVLLVWAALLFLPDLK